MPMDFPASPVVGQVYNGYTWTGVAWEAGYTPVVPNLQLATYANAAARDAAITSPQVGMEAYLTDVKQVTVYNGSAWKSDMAGLVPIVPPTVAVSGGTATVNSLGTITFSSATSISLNGVFTPAYRNYRIILEAAATSGSPALGMRFRKNGVDSTAAANSYGVVLQRNSSTSLTAFYSTGSSTYAALNNLSSTATGPQFNFIDVINPNVSGTYVGWSTYGYGADATSAWHASGSGIQGLANDYDGVTILPLSVSFSGNISVFGYNS